MPILNICIFRPNAIRYSRFLLWTCDVSLLWKNITTNTVLRWIVWSCNALYSGRHPDSRPGNRPLKPYEQERAGSYITEKRHQFQVVELRGDWEFHKFIWQFKCSWKGGVNVGICFRCPAMLRCADTGLQYWNMDDQNSTWAQQEFGTVDYINKRLPAYNICTLDMKKNVVLQLSFLLGTVESMPWKPYCGIGGQCMFSLYNDRFCNG